jgi:hypothetical protein
VFEELVVECSGKRYGSGSIDVWTGQPSEPIRIQKKFAEFQNIRPHCFPTMSAAADKAWEFAAPKFHDFTQPEEGEEEEQKNFEWFGTIFIRFLVDDRLSPIPLTSI